MPFILQLLLALPGIIKMVIELIQLLKGDQSTPADKQEFEEVKANILRNKALSKEDKTRLEKLRERLKLRRA